jgi:hypothetical protein
MGGGSSAAGKTEDKEQVQIINKVSLRDARINHDLSQKFHQLSERSLGEGSVKIPKVNMNGSSKFTVSQKFALSSKSQKISTDGSKKGVLDHEFSFIDFEKTKITRDSIDGPAFTKLGELQRSDGNAVEGDFVSKANALTLVKWILRLNDDIKEIADTVNFFENCLEGPISFEEFCMMYEEISTRVQLDRLFNKKLEELVADKDGYLKLESINALTDYMLMKFAAIWCSKRELVGMRKTFTALFEKLQKTTHLV